MFQQIFHVLGRGKLTVLPYHKVPHRANPLAGPEPDVESFDRLLQDTMRLFRILPLDEALQALRAGNLPPRAACITFDDGYPDWLNGVVPVLEKHGAHATFFITTGQFQGLPMWHERILHAVGSAPEGTPELRLTGASLPPQSVGSFAERKVAIQHLDRFLKYQPPDQRELWLQELEHQAGASPKDVPVMSESDLRDLHARGFGIGAHTVSHPILSSCAVDRAYEEVAGSREMLESMVRGKVTAFAYPNGVPERDFGPEHIDMVRRAGYTSAFTTHHGTASIETSQFQIPRFAPWGPSVARMKAQFARNLTQRSRILSEETSGHKRALMVAFHFPPQAGSSGILRTLNFVKYLPRHDWAPSVLTARPMAYAEQRNDLVASIPTQTPITRAFALDAARHLSIGGKYPGLLAVPDRWSSWWLPAVLVGLREIRRQRPDLIWSTYPISTAHLIAGTLSRLSGLPWVADFRDPMVSAEYPSDRIQRRLWQRLEARVLRNAAACVFTTERAAQNYRQLYPAAAAKCHVIENGYDEEAFAEARADRMGLEQDRLLLLHSGVIYPNDRDPSTLFAAVRALVDQGRMDPSKLCIRFRAPQHGDLVMEVARRHGVESMVEIAPPVAYQQSIAEMMASDLLLVFQGSNFNAQIPAKVYEYLRAERPMLAILDPRGDTATQLRQFAGVRLADEKKVDAIRDELLDWLGKRGSEQERQALEESRRSVGRYSRLAQAERLGVLLDQVSGHAVARTS